MTTKYWLILGVAGGLFLGFLLRSKTDEKQKTASSLKESRFNLAIGLIPIIIAVSFSSFYQLILTHDISRYILTCAVSVIVNLCYMLIISFVIKKEEYLEQYKNNAVIFFVNLTLVIPFSIFFILSSFIFSSFRLPFTY